VGPTPEIHLWDGGFFGFFGCFHSHGGIPSSLDGDFFMENPIYKWMMNSPKIDAL
jgi:hypothetical protein